MAYNIAGALENLVPNPDYFGSLTANTEDAYNAITWNDTRTKPLWADVLTEDGNAYKAFLKLQATVYRNNRANGGFTYRAVVYAADYTSVNSLGNAYSLAVNNPSYAIQWKAMDGTFVNLSNADIIALYTAMHSFQEQLFNAESTADNGIDAGTITDLVALASVINSVPNSA